MKVTGLKETNAKIKKALSDAIKSPELFSEVEDYLDNLLHKNQKADGSQHKEKAPSTKRQYIPKGYDTENRLIRTGDSTILKKKTTKNSLVVYPKGQTILGYHKKDAEDTFTLNENAQEAILEIITTKLKEAIQ